MVKTCTLATHKGWLCLRGYHYYNACSDSMNYNFTIIVGLSTLVSCMFHFIFFSVLTVLVVLMMIVKLMHYSLKKDGKISCYTIMHVFLNSLTIGVPNLNYISYMVGLLLYLKS